MNGSMKKLLLMCLAVLFVFGRGLCALPAPLNPTMSSVNFKHELRWTAAPDSPPGLTYHVYASDSEEWKEVATTKNLWAEVELDDLRTSYSLFVRSSLNTTRSPRSQPVLTFTPYVDTIITAPNVTISGCGNCIQCNISLPNARRNSAINNIRDIYNLYYNVSWRRKGQEAVSIETKNQTVIIPHLLPFTEYCVQVKPEYVRVTFEPSPWKCVFTSTVQPRQAQVFAVVGSIAGLAVFILFCTPMYFILKYTGIICKIKEAVPHSPITSIRQCSLLRLERTVPDPVSLLPETGRQQHSHWDQDEEDHGTDWIDQMEDQEEDQYMNRCADLSSDSSCSGSHMTSSCQSAPTVSDHPGSKDEETEEQKDEQAQIIKKEDWMKEESKDCKDVGEWLSELEKYESVNLLSVTIATLDLQSDEEQCDAQPLLHTPDQTHIHQQLQESDTAEKQSQMNYYMRH